MQIIGGGGGNRTRVQRIYKNNVYERSHLVLFFRMVATGRPFPLLLHRLAVLSSTGKSRPFQSASVDRRRDTGSHSTLYPAYPLRGMTTLLPHPRRCSCQRRRNLQVYRLHLFALGLIKGPAHPCSLLNPSTPCRNQYTPVKTVLRSTFYVLGSRFYVIGSTS